MENRIKENIRKSGKMQADIARELGITTVGLSQLVNARMPKVETIEKIASAVGVPAWAMLLSDAELNEIREGLQPRPNIFQCPKCGTSLKVVPLDECECESTKAANPNG